VTGEHEEALWAEQVRVPWSGTGAVVRVGWLPAKLADVITLMHEIRNMAGAVILAGRVGVGSGLLRVESEARTQAAVVERLRSSVCVGNVAVLRATRELKERVDVWGSPAPAINATRALKQMFDPAGILGAGRGPV
jgi:hypothetical protein